MVKATASKVANVITDNRSFSGSVVMIFSMSLGFKYIPIIFYPPTQQDSLKR